MLHRHVVLTGRAGAGKSTLGLALAGALGTALLSKDKLKEALHESLPAADGNASLQLGAAAMHVLYRVAGDSGSGLVLEANWHLDTDLVRLSGLPLPLLQIHCDVPPDVARRRVLARVETGMRHPVHRDAFDPQVLRLVVESVADPCPPVPLGVPVLVVDTSDPVDTRPVVDWVNAHDQLGAP